MGHRKATEKLGRTSAVESLFFRRKNHMAPLQPFPEQLAICVKHGVSPQLFQQKDRLGIAIDTLNLVPINGMRVPALSGSSGWFIFGGDQLSDCLDFFQPLCVGHLHKYCGIAIPYLCLPAGWRFQVDADGYEDVWYDDRLLSQVTS